MTDTPERECGSGIRAGDECKIVHDSSGSKIMKSAFKIGDKVRMQARTVFESVDDRESSADSSRLALALTLAAPSAGGGARLLEEVNGVYHPDGSTHNDKPVYKKVGGSRCVYYSGKKGHGRGAAVEDALGKIPRRRRLDAQREGDRRRRRAARRQVDQRHELGQ